MHATMRAIILIVLTRILQRWCTSTRWIDSDLLMVVLSYDAGNTNTKNRQQSGCETADGAICNKLPFSQRLHDPLNSALGDITVNCDEWPMATTKQADFKDGTVRNSLRCIPSKENSSTLALLLSPPEIDKLTSRLFSRRWSSTLSIHQRGQ